LRQVPRPTASLSSRTIVFAYVLVGVLWIALSDRVIGALVRDADAVVLFSTLKGWLFIATTGAVLAVMLARFELQRARQADEISSHENRFRLLAEHAPDVISRYRVLPAPAFEYVSPSVETVLGYPPAAFYADPGLMERLVHADDRHLLTPNAGAPQVADAVLLRLFHADGHWVWLEQRSRPIVDADGRLVAVEGVARDVTERQVAQLSLARLNRVLLTLTEANAALVHAQSEAELLEAICRIVVEQGAYRYAWVGYREDDEAGTVRPVTSAGYGPGYRVGSQVTWRPTERGLGPVGTSIREARTVVLADIASDPTYAPWRDTALALGYVSGAAIPLLDAGRAFGTLVIYSDERDTFGAEEIDLLEQLAADLAFGVLARRDATHLREVETTLEGTARARAQIAATLAALQPGETPEVTGQAIADALLGLEGMDSPTVFIFDEAGRAVVLARSGGRTDPVPVGGVLPERRSAYLLERARRGAWAEQWTPDAEDGDYGARFVATGLLATAYAPIPGEDGPIGLLAVATTDRARAKRLGEQLPALGEFAPTARLLLEKPLRERFDLARSRTWIASIVERMAFHPVFQPLVDLATGRPIGFEALTRFDDGTPPDRVFAEARRCSLEPELESATLRAALVDSVGLPADCFLSLNVSPAIITAGGALRAILASRTRPIVLEVTEHDHVDDYGALRSAFVALGSGLRLAVDDAGAGVANFNHLVELRPQLVKVDIGLVRGVNADLTRQALIVALQHFASATDCQVVAEGIETEAERAVLERLEIPYGQGYLFGRPARAEAWLAVPADLSARRRRRAVRSVPRVASSGG
jgi:PAS domain S-box-containing protein